MVIVGNYPDPKSALLRVKTKESTTQVKRQSGKIDRIQAMDDDGDFLLKPTKTIPLKVSRKGSDSSKNLNLEEDKHDEEVREVSGLNKITLNPKSEQNSSVDSPDGIIDNDAFTLLIQPLEERLKSVESKLKVFNKLILNKKRSSPNLSKNERTSMNESFIEFKKILSQKRLEDSKMKHIRLSSAGHTIQSENPNSVSFKRAQATFTPVDKKPQGKIEFFHNRNFTISNRQSIVPKSGFASKVLSMFQIASISRLNIINNVGPGELDEVPKILSAIKLDAHFKRVSIYLI